ncbi:tectonic-3-like [Notolabrus celidotus]|uniref:tectonic-3-like n=1 Tax=Notolabrus celidotus TaxID=1203425 RepID=UPI001490896E|nr:tectonic-3-like [Notolabrus celidotus]
MSPLLWFCSVQICILLCGGLAHAATDSGGTSTVSPGSTNTNWGSFSSATPPPSGSLGTDESTGVSTTEAVPLDSTLDSTLDPIATTTLTVSEAPPTVVTETSATTSPPVVTSQGCLCDLTPDFCDIGCCCDIVDCNVSNLSTIFTGCPHKPISGVCIEKWLMFRANVDSSLVTVTDSLFCVRPEDNTTQSLQALPQFPALGDSYHFSPPAPLGSIYSRDFYRADDVILTYFNNSSVRGLLRQPSPGAASDFCVNRNPAKFLRSMSLSCTRMLTPDSCSTDPTLNARSYFSDFRLIKIPIIESAEVSDLLVPVTPLSDWPAPSKQNNSCVNVVKKVEFVISYTGRGELVNATVNVTLAKVDPNQSLSQTHSVQFKLMAPSPTPGAPIPAVGLPTGSPVIGRFDEDLKPLTTLGLSQGGECSSDPNRRAPILFTHNTITGCTFSSPSSDCSELRSYIYGILQGLATPDLIAMNSGSQPDWARVITQECSVSLQETCESGCFLPTSLSIRVLWARQGLLHLPQNYILGAKYIFHCQNVKCPLLSPIALTTEVTFVDTTVYPQSPLGSPQPDWKYPFGFFTRGSAELDGHIVTNSSDRERVTWSLMLFTVTLLTGLEFFFG